MKHYPNTVKTAPLKGAISAQQAIENSPALGRLAGLVKESSARLKAIESLIPESLRSAVQAGPIDGEAWCLLVSSNAAAAKLRQLLPRIQSRLQVGGSKITSIRLKILIARK